ncbi:COX15/CtaA family protein [Halorhabdus amylolytica]|uniref:COX15/CtaA family protein n=1 Tax=Halorhabdus amylolytica TaxID=2559573 RepID=UPI0010A9F471|nr:COX15/CtaA family protein [Halorhabdus amylolytica]
MNRRFRYLVAVTTAFVFATILLGIATKSYGAGLACEARWPVCDGGILNLFPESFPSFFEWIHRVVAGVGGLFIVGSAIEAWRRDVPPKIRNALTVGALLTPLQVVLGQQTVVNFTFPVLTAHFWTAFTIFAAFAFALVTSWADVIRRRHLRAAAVVTLALFPVQVLLTPPFISSYTPVVQTLQYAVLLVLVLAVVALVVVGRPAFPARYRHAPVVAVVALVPTVYLGRHLLAGSTVHRAAYLLAGVVVFGALVASTAGVWRSDGAVS